MAVQLNSGGMESSEVSLTSRTLERVLKRLRSALSLVLHLRQTCWGDSTWRAASTSETYPATGEHPGMCGGPDGLCCGCYGWLETWLESQGWCKEAL